MATTIQKSQHLGRKIERIRELRGMKQDTLAQALGISQQAVSRMEGSEEVEEERLLKVAEVLGVPAEAIKNFSEEAVFNIIANTVTNHDNSAFFNYFPNYNPVEKISELYERLLQSEREKVEMLQALLSKK